jgi:hypothetical protein
MCKWLQACMLQARVCCILQVRVSCRPAAVTLEILGVIEMMSTHAMTAHD